MQSLFVLKNEVPHSIHEPAHVLNLEKIKHIIVGKSSCFYFKLIQGGQLSGKKNKLR